MLDTPSKRQADISIMMRRKFPNRIRFEDVSSPGRHVKRYGCELRGSPASIW